MTRIDLPGWIHPPSRVVRARWFFPERDPLGQCVQRDHSVPFLLLGHGDGGPARKPLAPPETTGSPRDHEGRADLGRRRTGVLHDHALGCGLGPAARVDDRGRSNLLGRAWGMGFSRDGETLAVGRTDGDLELWDVATRSLRARLRGHSRDYTPQVMVFGTGRDQVVSMGMDWSIPSVPAQVVRTRPQPVPTRGVLWTRAASCHRPSHHLGCRFPPAAGQARGRGLATPLPRRQDPGDEPARRAYHALGCLVGITSVDHVSIPDRRGTSRRRASARPPSGRSA